MRRIRERTFDRKHAQKVYEHLMRDLRDGQYQWAQLTPAIHRQAERFLMALDTVPLRAADALHLAIAAVLDVGSLITFDEQMAAAARKLGTFDLLGG